MLFTRNSAKSETISKRVTGTWIALSMFVLISFSGSMVLGQHNASANDIEQVSNDDVIKGQDSGENGAKWDFYNKDSGEYKAGTLVIQEGKINDSIEKWNKKFSNNIKFINFSGKVLSPKNSYGLFSGLSNLEEIINGDNVDTSNVTDMSDMFYSCNSLTSLDGLKNWNTSNVKNMSGMFANCQSLTNVDGLKNWNTSNVKNMSGMFYSCQSLTNVDGLKNWDTSKVERMNNTFSACKSLTSLDGLKNWNTSNVESMIAVFKENINLKKIDISNWNTQKLQGRHQISISSSVDSITLGPNSNGISIENSKNDPIKAMGKSPQAKQFNTGEDLSNMYNQKSDYTSKVRTYLRSNNNTISEAKKAIQDQADKTKDEVNRDDTLSDNDKKNQNNQIDLKLKNANDNIDELINIHGLSDAVEKGKQEIINQHQPVKKDSNKNSTMDYGIIVDSSKAKDVVKKTPSNNNNESSSSNTYVFKNNHNNKSRFKDGSIKFYNNPQLTEISTNLNRYKINNAVMFKIVEISNTPNQQNQVYKVCMISNQTGRLTKTIKYIKGVNINKITLLYYEKAHKDTKVKVINKSISSHKDIALKSKFKTHVYKKGKTLSIKSIVKYGAVYRFKLMNGQYITANKCFVEAI